MKYGDQLEFESTLETYEDTRYLSEQLITYIGNKRSLQGHINSVVEGIRKDLGDRKLVSCDAFSGSGIVSRLLKRHSNVIWSNDLEDYATSISKCYLTNKDEYDHLELMRLISEANNLADTSPERDGFISELYSPKDDLNIQPGERVFYTASNAQRLDTYAKFIQFQSPKYRDLLLGPLLSAASVNANTGGVFKGFYKDSQTGIGKYGGSGQDALKRILAPIKLTAPVLSRFDCISNVVQGDAANLHELTSELDLAYLDPPYNQHPYGSNYFMLNLLVNYQRPTDLSSVSGIPADWNRSDYNVRQKSFSALTELVQNLKSKYIVISFSDDGFLEPAKLIEFLENLGEVNVVDIDYNTFRGSRNLKSRSIRITEHLFILKRK
jgi:adenine-specific DNA-methyltransferase